jgi:hypothetical protein
MVIPVNYPDGRKMIVGDRLKLWDGCHGTVVCSIEDDEYTSEHSRDQWAYLKTGVLIDSGQAGLIHYVEPEDAFELIERKVDTGV